MAHITMRGLRTARFARQVLLAPPGGARATQPLVNLDPTARADHAHAVQHEQAKNSSRLHRLRRKRCLVHPSNELARQRNLRHRQHAAAIDHGELGAGLSSRSPQPRVMNNVLASTLPA